MALIPEDPRQRNAFIAIILLLAGLYVFHAYWYTPRAEAADQMEERLEDLEERNRQAQVLAARGGQELRERMQLYERHVSRLEQLIPQREELPTLINQITDRARRIGVEVTSLNPAAREPGAYYTRQSYSMAVVGEYHDVAEFITAIASLPRIITPINLDIQEARNLGDLYGIEAPIMVTFQMQTYVLPQGQERTQASRAQPPSGG